MASKIAQHLRQIHERSEVFRRTASAVVEENKTLLWLIGTGSSALAGWAVYTLRRLHYAKIQEDMNQIVSKIDQMDSQSKELADVATRGISSFNMKLVLLPATASAFLFGYMVGRTTTSYKWIKKLKVNEALKERRVYVAVVPEQLFEAKMVARELEKAVAEVKSTELQSSKSGWKNLLWGSSADTPDEEEQKPKKRLLSE
mmetsp:Transcript_90045/g.156026  ORF Transcript_90045/g.156026 Transcript_90045/m.156026 type:complete len:201 (+) Transcript_90045:100-702(+)